MNEGGVKQDITYIFLRNWLNFDSVEFKLPATRISLITVEQSANNPGTEEPCDLQDSFIATLRMRHSSPNRNIIIIIIIIPSRYVYMFHVICCRASQKNIVHEVLDFLKKFLASISPKIIQKTENDTVGR